MIYYTYKELQRQLKEANLPSSRTHLNVLEKLGQINRPENVLKFHVSNNGLSTEDMRIYSQSEIEAIIKQVRKIKNL